ncbi:DUF3043 domain-containing protein [Jatrophihabitans endophyticus]|uniref:DUF3043 domain-containing protein n=1 Tax=Jatrophihabitans endophyticus TaxID=1206085 RepID=UPI0019E74789|nr:DUF3043 domain-containing protein [Jatrophihabitans endophyticus]MBE7187727.1 DUF3043 domain-containing protein [Jatrophihabitans endophyticus]
MKLNRRSAADDGADTDLEPSADEAVDLSKSGDDGVRTTPKGRPTPKRRDAEGRRGPVTAPKTRKEAYARQKQLNRDQRQQQSAKATLKPRSAAEQRAALKRGDASALPRRDQGPTKKLARDYVDSHRMFSNYLLWLFALFVISSLLLPAASPVVLVIFLFMIAEWYWVGRKLRALAIERHGSAEGTTMSLGFYMGSRAYLPRKWRLPGPQVQLGDEI